MKTIRSGATYYKVDDQGLISGQHVTASGEWKLLGAVEYNNFGNPVQHYSLQSILEQPETIPWQFKNGKQRVHIIDLDHGTRRVWMTPNHKVF